MKIKYMLVCRYRFFIKNNDEGYVIILHVAWAIYNLMKNV